MGDTKELWQVEDAALKTSMQFFADELLPYFNIEGKVKNYFKISILLWKTEPGNISSSKVRMAESKI